MSSCLLPCSAKFSTANRVITYFSPGEGVRWSWGAVLLCVSLQVYSTQQLVQVLITSHSLWLLHELQILLKQSHISTHAHAYTHTHTHTHTHTVSQLAISIPDSHCIIGWCATHRHTAWPFSLSARSTHTELVTIVPTTKSPSHNTPLRIALSVKSTPLSVGDLHSSSLIVSCSLASYNSGAHKPVKKKIQSKDKRCNSSHSKVSYQSYVHSWNP